ncbi:MAG: DUF4920 domain-containing protein [Phycisphaerae bacterium]
MNLKTASVATLSLAAVLAGVSATGVFAEAPATQPSADTAAVKGEACSECTACSTEKTTEFGEPLAEQVATVTLAEVLADPSAFNGRTLKVSGVVTEVCSTSGCWMELATAEGNATQLLVKFTCPVDGRLIPMEAKGKQAVAAGKLTVEEVDEATARHYAEEGGRTAEQIAAIKGPQIQVRLDGPWAQVSGL